MNSEQKVKTLLRLIGKENNDTNRYKGLCRILGNFICDTTLIPVWINALKDSNKIVREVAATILIINPHESAYNTLLSKAMKNEEWNPVRRKAIYALSKIHSKQSDIKRILIDIAEDPNESQKIRETARFAIEKNLK